MYTNYEADFYRVYYNEDDPSCSWVYDYEPGHFDEEEGYRVVPIDISEITAEEFAAMMDGEAESANYHDFVGRHEWLTKLLIQELGRAAATRIMARIFMESGGGLHHEM